MSGCFKQGMQDVAKDKARGVTPHKDDKETEPIRCVTCSHTQHGSVICCTYASYYSWYFTLEFRRTVTLIVVRGKRWDENLHRPDLDYSEIYEDDVGQVPGMFCDISRTIYIWNRKQRSSYGRIAKVNCRCVAGITCWEIENFLPNQLDDGTCKTGILYMHTHVQYSYICICL